MLVLRVANGLGAAGEGEVARRRGSEALSKLYLSCLIWSVSVRLQAPACSTRQTRKNPEKVLEVSRKLPAHKGKQSTPVLLLSPSAHNSQPLRLDTGRKPR
jgi:hypothetical protein